MKSEPNFEQMSCKLTQENRRDFPKLHTVKLRGLIRDIYGGDLDFVQGPDDCDGPLTFLNFVTDRGGVFNLKHMPGGGPVSKGNQADAFVMALLRACADGVMVGANTLNGESEHEWHVDFIFDKFPQMANKDTLHAAFKQWRRELGRIEEHPPTFFMTNSGKLNFGAAVFKNSGIKKYVVTNSRAASWLRGDGGMSTAKLTAINTQILEFGSETLDAELMMRELKQNLGIEYLLHEGGRGVADALVRQGLIHQLFVTRMSHVLAQEVAAEHLEHLFSSPDHGHPALAKTLTVREDSTGTAELHALSLEGVPQL